MSSTALFQQLEALFQQQLGIAEELNTILQNENQALIKRDHQQIQQLSHLKETKTAEIEALSQKQVELLSKFKLPYSAEALDKLINTMPTEFSHNISQLRHKLEALLESCQQQNIINGQIIAVNRQTAETALAILRGQVSPDGLTYGSAGQAISEQSSNSISKA